MLKIVFYTVSGVILLVAYPLLISAWITVQITPGLQPKDYLFLVQVTLTFIATVGIGFLTAANARSTIQLQASLTREIGNATERLRAQLTRETDALKTRIGEMIPKEHEAYHAMWKAATEYYRALQDLEVGEFPEERLKEADDARNDAWGKSLLVKKADRDEFDNFLTEIHYVRENAARIRGDKDKLENFWRENYKKLSDFL